MLIMSVLVAGGSFLLPLVYGARFADATIQLLILLPGVCLIGIESVLVQHFTGTGLPAAIPVFWLLTLAFTSSEIGPERVTNLVAVGSIGTAGGTSIVNLPSPNPVFRDVAADGYVLPKDIPAENAPSG